MAGKEEYKISSVRLKDEGDRGLFSSSELVDSKYTFELMSTMQHVRVVRIHDKVTWSIPYSAVAIRWALSAPVA